MAFHEFCSCLTENEIISFFSSLHLIFERQQAFLASHIYDGRRRRWWQQREFVKCKKRIWEMIMWRTFSLSFFSLIALHILISFLTTYNTHTHTNLCIRSREIYATRLTTCLSNCWTNALMHVRPYIHTSSDDWRQIIVKWKSEFLNRKCREMFFF